MSEGEALARRFHELYEAMAPGFGYETRTETREFDPESNNGKLMIAVCSVIQGILTARLAEAEAEAIRYVDLKTALTTMHETCEVLRSQRTSLYEQLKESNVENKRLTARLAAAEALLMEATKSIAAAIVPMDNDVWFCVMPSILADDKWYRAAKGEE